MTGHTKSHVQTPMDTKGNSLATNTPCLKKFICPSRVFSTYPCSVLVVTDLKYNYVPNRIYHHTGRTRSRFRNDPRLDHHEVALIGSGGKSIPYLRLKFDTLY